MFILYLLYNINMPAGGLVGTYGFNLNHYNSLYLWFNYK